MRLPLPGRLLRGASTSPSAAASTVVRAVPAPAVFITGATSGYVGAGLAVPLFATIPSTTVAWWRVTLGALVLLAWRRPWRRAWSRQALATCAAFGVATATMNVLFYASIGHLPMGTAVSLEFTGPVAVALSTGRGWRPRLAALLALAGVVSISGLGLDMADPSQRLGLLLALAAGGAWACYILLGRRVAVAGAGLDSLAVASAAGSLAYLPLAAATAVRVLTSVPTALTVAAVAVMSTVVPYALDQVNLRRLGTDAFALLSSLMPATSLVVGMVMLRQLPSVGELLGLVLVSVAVALAGTS